MNAIEGILVFPLAVAGPLRLLLDVLSWLASPTVIGWIGIGAAIVAAFAVCPRQWLSGPVVFFGRTAYVVIVWVTVVLILSAVTPDGTGAGSGAGDAVEQDDLSSADPLPAAGSGTVVIKPLSDTDAAQFGDDIIIRFVPSKANADLAQPFACDLLLQLPAKPPSLVEIRSTSTSELIQQFAAQLLENATKSKSASFSVRIDTNPFPGEPVIQKLKQVCRDVNPNCDFILGE